MSGPGNLPQTLLLPGCGSKRLNGKLSQWFHFTCSIVHHTSSRELLEVKIQDCRFELSETFRVSVSISLQLESTPSIFRSVAAGFPRSIVLRFILHGYSPNLYIPWCAGAVISCGYYRKLTIRTKSRSFHAVRAELLDVRPNTLIF